jgi:hypothetical protein
MSTQSAKIYLRACAGFANRLRATISGICAAEEAGRAIQISWPYEPTFSGSFTDFFDVAASQLPEWLTFGVVMNSPQAEALCLTTEEWLEQSKKPGPTYIKSYAQFYTTPRFEFWLRSMKPRQEFVERVDEVFQGLTKPPIGIHIRRTDHWRSIAESPTGEFVRIMDQYPPGTVFFVASDSDEERIVLRGKYSAGRILTGATILSRSMTVGAKHAFIDFLALSRCSEIVGSWWSSFSEMAAAYGSVPLRVARVL